MEEKVKVASVQRAIKVTKIWKKDTNVMLEVQRPTQYGEDIIEVFSVEIPHTILKILQKI